MARKADHLKFEAMSRLAALGTRHKSLKKFKTLIDPLFSALPTFEVKPYGFDASSKMFTPMSTKYKVGVKGKKLIPKLFFVNGQKAYKCTECGFQKASWSSVNGHIMLSHKNLAYTCAVCGWQSASQDSFRRHSKTHTKK